MEGAEILQRNELIAGLPDIARYHTPAVDPGPGGHDESALAETRYRPVRGSNRVQWTPQEKDRAGEPVSTHVISTFATAQERTRNKGASFLHRSLSVKQSYTKTHEGVVSGVDSARANTPIQRRCVVAEQAPPSTRSRSAKMVLASGRTYAVRQGKSSTGRGATLKAGRCYLKASLGISESPRLRQTRTWLLLQHLLDKFEAAQKQRKVSLSPEEIIQQRETLQKVLQPLMPLLPLSKVLHQLIEQGTTSASSQSVELTGKASVTHVGSCREFSSPALATKRSLELRSKSVRKTNPTSGRSSRDPLSSFRSVRRSAYSQSSLPGLSSWPISCANRAAQKAPESRTDALQVDVQGGSWYLARHSDCRLDSVECLEGRISLGRGRTPGKYDSRTSPWRRGPKELHQSVGRPLFAWGRNVPAWSQVASRLPPGALEHKRSPKALNRGGSLDKKQLLDLPKSCKDQVNFGRSQTTEVLSSGRSSDSEKTLKIGTGYSSSCVSPDCTEAPLTGWEGNLASWWRQAPKFTSARNLGALPASSLSSDVDSGRTPHDTPPEKPPLQHGGSWTDIKQAADLESERSGSNTMQPRLTPRSLGQRLAEHRVSPLRRQTVMKAASTTNAESDKLLRGQQQSHEPLVAPVKRERHLTVAEAMKRKGLTLTCKAGRVVHEADESEKDSPNTPGSAHVSRLNKVSRGREARRATAPVISPTRASSLSPTRLASAKPRPQRPSVYGKALARKDSKGSLQSPRVSPRELVSGGAGGRRLSTQPTRKPPQAKGAPPTVPRARLGGSSGSAAPVGSLSIKSTSGRKKAGKVSSTKPKHKAAELPKCDDQPSGKAQTPENEREVHKAEESKIQSEPKSPYPFLRLSELPALEAPIRPLPQLLAMPLKKSPDPPPQIDDSVTFLHVLDRSQRLTEEARDQATQQTVTNLCSDGPGTMMLIARWMDTATDTVASNNATVTEKLPWGDVIPPLFVGIDTHRELLNPRMQRSALKVADLRAFLESEGFIQTKEQRLRQLLGPQQLHTKPLEEEPKPPTPLDTYLDFLLAVATSYLQLRKQPLILPKITRYVVGTRDESDSTECSADTCCLRGASVDSEEEGAVNSSLLPLVFEDNVPPTRRCWSCMPIRGRSGAYFCTDGISRSQEAPGGTSGSVFSCGYFSSISGRPESNLFESTAAQQVRDAVSRMHLLPSEKYLRYLRILRKKNELEALAIWLAGTSETIINSAEYKAWEAEQDLSSSMTSSSSSDSGDTKGENSNRTSLGNTGRLRDENSTRMIGEDGVQSNKTDGQCSAQPQPQETEGQDSDESMSSVSLYSTPSTPDGGSNASLRLSEAGVNRGGVYPPGLVSGEDKLLGGQHPTKESPKQSSSLFATASQDVGEVSSMTAARALSWGRPSEPAHPMKSSATGPAHPVSRPTASIANASAKVKASKQPLERSAPPHVSSTSERTLPGRKLLREAGPAQRQALTKSSSLAATREQQKRAKNRLARHSAQLNAKPGTSEPAGEAPVHSHDTGERCLDTITVDQLVGISSHAPTCKTSPTLQGRATTSSRQQLMNHQNGTGRLHQQLKPVQRRLASPAQSFSGHSYIRRAASTLPSKRGTVRVSGLTTTADGRPNRLTRDAMQLLTEPQVLAELAQLCARLSSLTCCKVEEPLVDIERTAELPSDIDCPGESNEITRCQE